ncbi:MAG: hypothetical protein IPI00_11730 [Flavobacteriales bacterium]|nr:hypothetical protein [Flavobacteriales bacterium]MBK6943301.1 hypothetical protein [Flavobacteriales bacterium]MBK7240821.1 hypothetical protein [Flavobacteriales bacterium]MBK7296568.1 hypothetical protein [Flavobacteriales bacterium]MBK9536169.1 hypothetical protein [Flavobacteriales bacterium]
MYRKLLLSTVIATTMSASAQNMCESIATRCEQHITENYIPDGQFYRALLQGDEIAEFSMTLFGGTTYRIAACSGETDGILLFTVYDREHNILYTNKDHFNAPYWDLSIANTMDVTVEADLDASKAGSGCAVLLMGFKK